MKCNLSNSSAKLIERRCDGEFGNGDGCLSYLRRRRRRRRHGLGFGIQAVVVVYGGNLERLLQL
jgi:hypothetical protein